MFSVGAKIVSRTLQVKQAKASEGDIDSVLSFFRMVEEFVEYGTHAVDLDGDGESKEIDDEEFVELVREAWNERGPGVGSSWTRVVLGCSTLIDNCCDPAASTLEWRPDIAAFLEGKAITVEQAVKLVQDEPEYPDPCHMLRGFIKEAIAAGDAEWIVHQILTAANQTKASIVARLQSLAAPELTQGGGENDGQANG